MTTWTNGDVSGSQTLLDTDHLYPSHINELRTAVNTAETNIAALPTASSTTNFTNKTLTSPILVTPALGTPASGVGTNITGITIGNTVNPYKVYAYRSGALSTTSGAATKITLDAESYDVNNNFTGGTYTVPVTGYYLVAANFTITATDADLACYIYVNGSVAISGTENTNSYGSSASGILYLTATNTVEMYYFTTAIKSVNVGASKTFMSIHLLSV